MKKNVNNYSYYRIEKRKKKKNKIKKNLPTMKIDIFYRAEHNMVHFQ